MTRDDPQDRSLAEMQLGGLLRVLAASKRSCVLVVTGAEGQGVVYMRRGRIEHARLGPVTDGPPRLPPREALFRMLTWNVGTFSLEAPQRAPVAEVLTESTEALLAEGRKWAQRRLDGAGGPHGPDGAAPPPEPCPLCGAREWTPFYPAEDHGRGPAAPRWRCGPCRFELPGQPLMEVVAQPEGGTWLLRAQARLADTTAAGEIIVRSGERPSAYTSPFGCLALARAWLALARSRRSAGDAKGAAVCAQAGDMVLDRGWHSFEEHAAYLIADPIWMPSDEDVGLIIEEVGARVDESWRYYGELDPPFPTTGATCPPRIMAPAIHALVGRLLGRPLGEAMSATGIQLSACPIIHEPPGIARGVEGTLPDGSPITLYLGERLRDYDMALTVADLRDRPLGGFAIHGASPPGWLTGDNVIAFHHRID